jgi:hypothetical protein
LGPEKAAGIIFKAIFICSTKQLNSNSLLQSLRHLHLLHKKRLELPSQTLLRPHYPKVVFGPTSFIINFDHQKQVPKAKTSLEKSQKL